MKIKKRDESKNQTAERSRAEENYVTEGIFCLLLRQGQKQDKKLDFQLFYTSLLVPLALVYWPRFFLVLEASIVLTVGPAIGGAESISKVVAVDLSK